jgi:uncharacterized protein (DUF305 family)
METKPNSAARCKVLFLAGCLALAPLSTLSQLAFAQGTTSPAPAPAHAAATGGTDMKGMMKEMSDTMSSMPMSGDPDVDFAMMMREHHRGAINMAEAELRNGKQTEMRKMARNIIAAQRKEIRELDKFLAKHGQAPASK